MAAELNGVRIDLEPAAIQFGHTMARSYSDFRCRRPEEEELNAGRERPRRER